MLTLWQIAFPVVALVVTVVVCPLRRAGRKIDQILREECEWRTEPSAPVGTRPTDGSPSSTRWAQR